MDTKPKKKRPSREQGFTLVEIMVTIATIVPGILALAGVLVTVSNGQEQTTLRSQVLDDAQSLMEEIRGANPATIFSNYDGKADDVDGVEPAVKGEQVLTVAVDDTDPGLLVVTITASWLANGNGESMVLRTEVFDDGA